MSCVERQREIEGVLLIERKVLVDDLSRRFQVSEVTIRKDLTELENRGVLLRTHGGAVLAEKPEMVIHHHTRSGVAIGEKNNIAKEAARRVRDGESILLDTGSTTLALARELKGHSRSLNIVTNSIVIATEMASEEQINVVVLGGTLRRSSLALMGSLALEQVKHLHVDRAFMGASGFDLKSGFLCQNLIEAETKQGMLSISHEVIMLVDSTKFTQTAFAPFCTLKSVDCVITDAPPPPAAWDALQKADVEVVITRK